MESEKITYILGAGASADALPIIRKGNNDGKFAISLNKFIEKCEQNFENAFQDSVAIQFKNDIYWLTKNCETFSTPDTFAKYLYHKDRNGLIRLKSALIGFFLVEQTIFKEIDNRPTTFITSLMEDSELLPDNIGIISWNYDSQMQLAFQKFQEEEFTSRDGANVHRPPLISYFPCQGHPHHFNQSFKLVQLNGIAGMYHDATRNLNLNLNLRNYESSDFSKIINAVYDYTESGQMLFTFAWENKKSEFISNVLHERINHALRIAEDTTILVIIGYSFPFFNRKIDNQIFSKILESKKLKKIYFQDPYNSGEFLVSQFNLPYITFNDSKAIPVIHIEEVRNYYIPFEL